MNPTAVPHYIQINNIANNGTKQCILPNCTTNVKSAKSLFTIRAQTYIHGMTSRTVYTNSAHRFQPVYKIRIKSVSIQSQNCIYLHRAPHVSQP